MAPRELPRGRDSAFEVALPCAHCGDEVAMSWPPKGGAAPARLVARCRTCREIAYIVARGDDGVTRVHPCGPGPYAAWPSDAWRPAPKERRDIYSPDKIQNRRPASAPQRRREVDVNRRAMRTPSSEQRRVRRQVNFTRGDREAHVALLASFADAVFARFPDVTSAFQSFDINGNGVISMLEFQVGADSIDFRGDASSVFWELDTSRRGMLSRRDFATLQRWAPQARRAQSAPRHDAPARQVAFQDPPPLPPPASSPPIDSRMRQDALPKYIENPIPSIAPGRRQEFRDYYDAYEMPPAGINLERERRPPGTVAHRRLQQNKEGKGVAAALDSWGEWRNWQERDDLGRFHEYVKFKNDAKSWEPSPDYPHAWPPSREPHRGEPYEFVRAPRLA